MSETTDTILYIDDDEGLRLLTRRALERRGFRVALAGSGDEGVALAAAEHVEARTQFEHCEPLKGWV